MIVSIFESIFAWFKITIPLSFSIKKQIGMTSRPNTSVIINTSGLILYVRPLTFHILFNLNIRKYQEIILK